MFKEKIFKSDGNLILKNKPKKFWKKTKKLLVVSFEKLPLPVENDEVWFLGRKMYGEEAWYERIC